jgi:Zn-dependent protease
MLNKNEILAIGVITLILAFTISLLKSMEIFLYTLLTVFLIIAINIIAKKVASFYFGTEIEVKMWEIKRYGFKAHRYFKRPFPAGAFFPIIVTAFSLGHLIWMASLIFEVKPNPYRKAKRHGLYTFSEMTEEHIGKIAAVGVLANLVFSILGYLMGYADFARLNIYFAFFNMLPLSNLDGNKIFFGSIVLWSFLASLVLIGLGYVFFLT